MLPDHFNNECERICLSALSFTVSLPSVDAANKRGEGLLLHALLTRIVCMCLLCLHVCTF